MAEWQPIETCPENTWVLCWASWETEPPIAACRFRWRQCSEWETVKESSEASGARRQIRQEKITREREWEGAFWGGDFWMPMPDAPR